MLDSMRFLAADSKREAAFFAIARDSKKILTEILGKARLSIPVAADENKKAFSEFAASEIVIPVAYIMEKGRIKWKGNPADIQGILTKIFNGTFSFSDQLRIDMLKRDLSSALRTSLPDVILKTADAILAIQKDEMTALQAKLFIYNNTGRAAESLDFLRKTREAAPLNIDVALLYLDSLARTGNRKEFTSEAEKLFKDTTLPCDAKMRLAAFALDNTPLGWLPAAAFMPLKEKLTKKINAKK